MTEQESIPPQPSPEESLKAEIPAPEGLETPAEAEEEIAVQLAQAVVLDQPGQVDIVMQIQRNKKDLGKMKDRFSDTFSESDSD